MNTLQQKLNTGSTTCFKDMNFDHINTIVNLSNSILKRFRVPLFHNSIKEIDQVLEGHKKICVLLFDGLGTYIQNKHLSKSSTIRKNFFLKISSTYPPTTVAATTGLLSGRFPIETGWLGWGVYIKEYAATVSCFLNKRIRDDIEVEDKHYIMNNICAYDDIFSLINKHNKSVRTLDLKCFPCYKDGPKSLREAKKRLDNFFKNKGESFAYFYWTKPDDDIHRFGVDSFEAHFDIEQINLFVRELIRDNPDVLFLSLADHGLVDIEYLDMLKHPDLCDCFLHEPGLEVRVVAFYIKEDKKELFKELFSKYYGKYFWLLNKEEVLKQRVFGFGKKHPRSDEFIGDFTAIAKDKYGLYLNQEINGHTPTLHKGHHAGLTSEEMEINLSIFNSSKNIKRK